MKRQKYIHNKESAIKKEIVICSECGEELELFGLSNSDVDIEKIRERYKRCKEKGKLKGDMCALLFIADENEPALWKDEGV